MFLFKTYMCRLEFEFDRHLEHMVSYEGMQSWLPMFVVGEFRTFGIFMQNNSFVKPDFGNLKNRSCFG